MPDNQRRLIHVAAAVIVDESRRILLARRPDDKHQGGLWEFPGGKVEPGEPVREALDRELHEELGIRVERARPLIQIPHHYPDKSVLLDVFLVEGFSGQAHGREGQPVCWVDASALDNYDFPAANRPILAAAQLPDRILITGNAATIDEYVTRVRAALDKGVRWIMLRAKGETEDAIAEIYARLRPICDAAGAVLAVNCEPVLASRLGADALHLSSVQLAELASRDAFEGRWLSASCHDAQQLERAASLGLDFTTLSPVMPTATHPGAEVLGWDSFAAQVSEAVLPVYALGGMGEEDLPTAWARGAQGIAAIRAWW
ncbi:MAG: Nudix family hydrolase [Oceanospirillaceae bacterium]|nr:Nudix family hydrolase [Oceanospirillaceae bacterium]